MSFLSPRFVPLGLLVVSSLPAQHSIVGHVYGGDGEPLPATEVHATLWTEGTALGRATTDGDGMFVLGDVPSAIVRVVATSPGRITGTACWYGDTPRRRGEVELTLWDATTVRGRVVDADGAPIASAEVFADSATGVSGLEWARTVTDARGEFALTESLGELRVQAWAPGYAVGAVVVHARGPEERADLKLVRGGGVEIRVRYEAAPDGGGPEDIEVEIRGAGPLPLALGKGRVPRGGEWRATGLPDIGYGVFAGAQGHVCEPASGYAQMGKAPYDFVFRTRPAPPRVEMRGRVVDEQGRPLAATTLVCGTGWTDRYDARVVTDENGGFVLPPFAPGWKCGLQLVDAARVLVPTSVAVPAGSFELTASGRSRAELMRPQSRVQSRCAIEIADGAVLELLVVPAQKVRGVVRCEGRALARAEVRLEEGTGGRWRRTTELCVTGENGSYEFDGLSVMEGTELRVGVTKADWFGTAAAVCEGDCPVVVLPDVEVQQGGVVTGVVRDRDNRPLPGVRVQIGALLMQQINGIDVPGRQPDSPTLEAMTDKDGRYCFRGVRPGDQMLNWQLGGRGSPRGWVAPIEVKAGQKVSRDFRVE